MIFLRKHEHDEDMYELFQKTITGRMALFAVLFVDHVQELLEDEELFNKVKSGQSVRVKLVAG